jgi:Galactose oxidase, central domain
LHRDRAPHTDEVFALFLDAFPSDPQFINLLNQRGYYHLEAGETDKALSVFELFVQQFPDSPYGYDGLADAQMMVGQKEKAKANAEKVLALLEKSSVSPAGKEALRKSAAEKLALQPIPRHNEKIVFDKNAKRLLLSGGSEYQAGKWAPPASCFEWDGATWKEYTEPGPAARRGHGLVYDEKEKAVLLIGGIEDSAGVEVTRLDVWRWKNNAWKRLDVPCPVKQSEAVYDPLQGRVLVYGDAHQPSQAWKGGMARAFELWELKAGKWGKLSADGPQVAHDIAFDAKRGALVVPAWAEGRAVVWEWAKGQWKKTVCAGDCPEERSRFALAYHEKEGAVYLFGGRNNDRVFLGDLWKWDGVAWTKVDAGSGPLRRAAAQLEYADGYLLLYGGTVQTANGKAGLSSEVWVLENGAWEKRGGYWQKF